MSKEYECRNLIRGIIGNSEQDSHVCIVKAVNVDTGKDVATCDVKRVSDNKEIKNVRLNATFKASHGIVISPKIDSAVLVTNIEGNKYFVSMFSEIEEIIINGGEKGGLIIIEELNNRLKSLEDKLNNHVHSGVIISVEGGVTSLAEGISGNTGTPTTTSNEFQEGYSGYENDKIKH